MSYLACHLEDCDHGLLLFEDFELRLSSDHGSPKVVTTNAGLSTLSQTTRSGFPLAVASVGDQTVTNSELDAVPHVSPQSLESQSFPAHVDASDSQDRSVIRVKSNALVYYFNVTLALIGFKQSWRDCRY